jgi:hypothetical protein
VVGPVQAGSKDRKEFDSELFINMSHWEWEMFMPSKRAHVILPEDLLADIDALVGQRGRSAFLVEVLRQEVNRRRLLQILSDPEPAWKDEDHPDLREGADVWVRKMRDEDERLDREKLGDWLQRSE